MSWVVWLVTAVNAAVAVWTGRQARRGRHALLLADERYLAALAREAALRHVIDRAWDAAHEFGDEPQVALSAACEYLEPLVTPVSASVFEQAGVPSQMRPCGDNCGFMPAPGGACPWCGWERPSRG